MKLENKPKEELNEVRKVIKTDRYRSNTIDAIFYSVLGICFYILGLLFLNYVWEKQIYYLYPVAWFLAGTMVTSLFILGHDCAHFSFLRKNRLNIVLGHFFFIPSFYPFYAWRYTHNAHHKYTNLLKMKPNSIDYDNAWVPLTVQQYRILKKKFPKKAFLYKMGRFFPPFGAFVHLITTHFFIQKFKPEERSNVLKSYIFLGLSLLAASSFLIYFYSSVFAVFHFIFLPGVCFTFWMSLYTYLHHTKEEIRFYPEREWNSYKGQVLSTFNSLMPKWISFIHFNIDVHLPHHISTAIPCYNLRKAQNDLDSSVYQPELHIQKFSILNYLKTIRNSNLWDDKNGKYMKFSEV